MPRVTRKRLNMLLEQISRTTQKKYKLLANSPGDGFTRYELTSENESYTILFGIGAREMEAKMESYWKGLRDGMAVGHKYVQIKVNEKGVV